MTWTTTGRETVNAALELAAAVEAHRRAELLGSFRELLSRLDVELIDREEANDHDDRGA
jgi:hypothetical protein